MVISHDANGFLPEGIHEATWADVVTTFGTNPRRRRMLRQLWTALAHLASAGCEAAFLAGSFVTTKANPGDLDVAWDVTRVDANILHPMFFDPRGVADVHVLFGGHFFPATGVEGATGMTFLEFFQLSRNGRRVGIVRLDLTTLEEDPD